MDPQLLSWCLPHTFQISDWKLEEDTTSMKLGSYRWLDACVWPDSNESWTCGRCSGVWPMNCFGRNRCHLICITQEIRYHRTGQPINQKVWKPEIHTNCSSPFVVFNCKGIPDSCPFCCGVNLHIKETYHQTPGNPGYPTCLPSQYSCWLFHCPCCNYCGQYRSLSLWPWIMAFVIALAQILEGQQLTYSRFVSGIKRLLINANLSRYSTLFFNFSLTRDYNIVYAIKHWFKLKYYLFVLVIIFYILSLN